MNRKKITFAYVASNFLYWTTLLEGFMRNKVSEGTMDDNFIVSSLNDFSAPYAITTISLCFLGNIKNKYQMMVSSILPTVFTINEYFPFIPGRGGKIANVFDENDIYAFWLAGTCAYLTSKALGSKKNGNYVTKYSPLANNKNIEEIIQ